MVFGNTQYVMWLTFHGHMATDLILQIFIPYHLMLDLLMVEHCSLLRGGALEMTPPLLLWILMEHHAL